MICPSGDVQLPNTRFAYRAFGSNVKETADLRSFCPPTLKKSEPEKNILLRQITTNLSFSWFGDVSHSDYYLAHDLEFPSTFALQSVSFTNELQYSMFCHYVTMCEWVYKHHGFCNSVTNT